MVEVRDLAEVEKREDADFYAELYRRHRSPLVWHVRSQGATETEACDAVQEAFAAALRTGRIRDQDAWYGWLRTVAVRSYRHARRARGESNSGGRLSVEFMPTADLPEPLGHSGATTSESAAAQLQEEFVLSLLRSLPPRQREVFCLHFEGCTAPEIAAQLGIQEAAVRQNISRARRLLKELISQGGEE
jgi:RNA polymerase sigma factor (sigma-70 family)